MAISSGDEGFDEVYPALFRRAATLAYRLLGDKTAAEDVAAEALARTYAQWPRIGALTHREGWVLR